MSLFVDQILVQLSDPAQLVQILAPANDPTQARLHLLLGAVYDMPFATIHDIRNVRVTSIESERALFPLGRTQGGWTQIIPAMPAPTWHWKRRTFPSQYGSIYWPRSI